MPAQVYAYGGTSTTSVFPTNTFNAANYWVDVVFNGDPDTTPETPTLAISSTSLNVAAGGSVALGITATPVDSDDILSLQIGGLPSYETITAPLEIRSRASNKDGTLLGPISESSSTTGAPLTGLTLSSSYTGTDHPVATLTVVASNTTSGETANSAPQTIVVTDPPATTLASATILSDGTCRRKWQPDPRSCDELDEYSSRVCSGRHPHSYEHLQRSNRDSCEHGVPDPKRQRNPNRRHQSAQQLHGLDIHR